MATDLTTTNEENISADGRMKTSFASDTMKLVAGTTFAQVLSILAAPLLAHLYEPEAFGIAALFTSIVTILAVLSNMRYELSIMLPKEDREAANLFALSLGSALLVSALIAVFILIAGQFILQILNAQELVPFLIWIPISLFLLGIFQALNYWNTRTKHFGSLSIARLSSSTITTTANICSGLVGFASGGALIIGSILGSFTSTAFLIGQIWRDDRRLFLSSIRFGEIIEGMKRYHKFPLYSTWAALLNSISWQLPTFLLATFFTPTIVGYYAIGNRLLRTPMAIIGSALAQVYFQRASQAKAEGNLETLVENTFQRLVKFGMFPLLITTIIGPEIFTVFLGERWAEAGVYTQILSIWTFFWFISSPMSTLFSVIERQEFDLSLNIVIILTRLASLLIGGVINSPRLAILLFAATGILVYGYLSLSIMSAAGVSWLRMFKILAENFLIFLPAGILLLIIKYLGFEDRLLISIAILILISYGIYLVRNDPQIWQFLWRSQVVNRIHKVR